MIFSKVRVFDLLGKCISYSESFVNLIIIWLVSDENWRWYLEKLEELGFLIFASCEYVICASTFSILGIVEDDNIGS